MQNIGSRLRVALCVWALALPGVLAATFTVVPGLLAGKTLPMRLETLLLISAVQSALLSLMAATLGGFLSPRAGLHAPYVEAFALRCGYPRAKSTIIAALLGGTAGALWLLLLSRVAPTALAAAQSRLELPLAVRLLYGGLTEEVLVRWGLMTFLVYVGSRLVGSPYGRPGARVIWVAIIVSAFAFGAAHLPAAKLLAGELTLPLVVYVLAGNAAFGTVAGWLYWRRGLECAMLCHAFAHLGAWLPGALIPI